MKRIYKLSLPIILIACASCGNDDSTSETIQLQESYTEDLVVHAGEVLDAAVPCVFLNGASLILEGGSQLRFSSDVIINVQGSLVAGAGSTNAVSILSSSNEQLGGIRVSGDSLYLNHVEISGLLSGIVADTDQIEVLDSEVKNCVNGLWISGGSGVIENSVFVSNDVGLLAESGVWLLSEISASGNQVGLRLISSGGELANSIFQDNVHAIESEDSDTTNVRNNQFDRNEIGVFYYYGRPELELNDFRSNDKSVFLSAYPRHDVSIHRNNFLDENDFAIYIIPRDWYNPHEIDVSDNYWNTNDLSLIAERIFDGFDHSPCDTLAYEPISEGSH
jgi:hypothetical protein